MSPRSAWPGALLLLLLATGCAGPNPTNKMETTMQQDKRPLWAIVFTDISARTEWGDEQRAIMKEHLAYLAEQQERGALRLGGVLTSAATGRSRGGWVLYRATDRRDAQHLMDEDPAVKRGLLLAELLSFEHFFGTAP